MAIGDDFSVAANGDIRYTGSGTNYTVIEFHRWLGTLMDDAEAAGDDLLDITDDTASERSTDNIVTLLPPYNIDDEAAKHLYDGSVNQDNGDTIYDGLIVYSAPGTYLTIMQNGKIVSPNFWTTGINADADQGISHRFMLKVRTGGANIDGRRIIGRTSEFGFTTWEFPNTTVNGNNVIALTYLPDLNNATAAATVAGWNTITNTEGYCLLDVDNDTVNEPYYSEWDRGAFTINQLYERAKWLARRATTEFDGSAATGTNRPLYNGAVEREAQLFTMGAKAAFVTRVFTKLKKVGSPTGNLTAKLYASDGASPPAPTGAVLATSKNIDVSKLTTSYQVVEIGFDTQFEAAASTAYFASFEYTGGNVSNYVHVEGSATSTTTGSRASYNGSWTGSATTDNYLVASTSPKLYGLTGEIFRGVTHQIAVDTPTGTFSAVEPVSWSGGTGQMLAIDSPTAATKMWIQLLTGVIPTNNQTITGGTSGATCLVNVTVTSREISKPFIGASTGTALIGGYGVGVETLDLSANDRITDLDGDVNAPPNLVTFAVSGLVVGEDRVLVGPENGLGGLDLAQFTLNGALSGAAVTSVVVNGAIPADTPTSGTIRLERASGKHTRHAYSAWAGSTFTIGATDFSSDNAPNGGDCSISYIDKLATATSESFTVIYVSDRSLFIRVRDGGGTPIKTFETTATLGSAGGSSTVIRTSDA